MTMHSIKGPPFPYTTLFRATREELQDNAEILRRKLQDFEVEGRIVQVSPGPIITSYELMMGPGLTCTMRPSDRKSTRLNSSHRCNSYAGFCMKKNQAPTHIT